MDQFLVDARWIILGLLIGLGIGGFSFTKITAWILREPQWRRFTSVSSLGRNYGYKYFFIAGAFEMTKGALAVFVVQKLTNDIVIPQYSAGVGAIIGHAMSIWFWSRGGKSLSVWAGIIIYLSPTNKSLIPPLLLSVTIGLALWYWTEWVSTFSLSITMVMWISSILLYRGSYLSFEITALVTVVSIIINLLFIENWRAILTGTERKTEFFPAKLWRAMKIRIQ